MVNQEISDMESEVEKIELPREPHFYPNEQNFPDMVGNRTEETLQSIDSTLKRIEQILLKVNKTSASEELSKGLSDVINETISRF